MCEHRPAAMKHDGIEMCLEDRAEAANTAAGGLVLAEDSLADLHRLADETGVPFPARGAR